MGYAFKADDVYGLASKLSADVREKGGELFFRYCPYCGGDGFTPWAVAVVCGNYTMEELARMQNSPPVPGKTRILYIGKTEYQARSPG